MALTNIINRNFTGINVFNISLVEETEPKDQYQSRFFMFIKAVPSIKSDQSPTGRTYDTKSAVTFKIEAEKALALSFALLQYANGRGKAYEDGFGQFTIFADMSKSTFNSSGSGDKKSMTIRIGKDQKGEKSNINMFFAQGNTKVALFLTPYESYAISKVVEVLALKCMDLELQGHGMVVKKQFETPKSNGFQQKTQSQNYSGPNVPMDGGDRKNIAKVSGDFGGMFGGDDPFGGSDDIPY
jgi:hypothetical protein